MANGRKGLPYAPYLMFMIERVTGYKFDKDGLHTVYKIEKTQASGASKAVRRSPSIEDVPKSSRSRPRKEKKMKKYGRWIKAIFTTCTYAARTAYEDRLENREANREAREQVRQCHSRARQCRMSGGSTTSAAFLACTLTLLEYLTCFIG